MYQVNLFKNLHSPQNPITIDINDYIRYVNNGFNEQEVMKARVYGKGSQLYERIKKNRHSVTINFLFKDYKKDENIISSTGLIYYDIDNSFSLDTIDKSKVFIHHKSFGGSGSTLIIKANEINTDNFKDSYYSIANELGISKLIDLNADKKTQFTVLSYDPSLYINENAFEFTATKKVSFDSNMYSSSYLPSNDTFLKNSNNTYRLTNASDYVDENNTYQVFPEGIQVAKIDIPRNIPIGNRTKTIMAITNQILTINPLITYEQVLKRILSINDIITTEPLPYSEIVGIVNRMFKYQKTGTLQPINNKIRKIIFNENCELSKEDKISIVRKEVGNIRSNKTKKKIHDAIVNWNQPEKITAKKIASKINMGIATVKKHWPEFKKIVIEYNNTLKNKD